MEEEKLRGEKYQSTIVPTTLELYRCCVFSSWIEHNRIFQKLACDFACTGHFLDLSRSPSLRVGLGVNHNISLLDKFDIQALALPPKNLNPHVRAWYCNEMASMMCRKIQGKGLNSVATYFCLESCWTILLVLVFVVPGRWVHHSLVKWNEIVPIHIIQCM